MNQTEQAETFEQVLLSNAEMCYSVAFALTSNPDAARDLAREVLVWAWHLSDSAGRQKNIKQNLLKELRKRFLKHYSRASLILKEEPVLAERV